IVLPAMVANDLEAFWRAVAFTRFFGSALRAALRGHHVSLVKDVLFLFGEKEGFFTLNARGFDVRHIQSPCYSFKRVTRQF
ncbi:MAG: hypothetical protein ABI481_08535, partial [Pyrinomonadaceae bacterium]